MSGHPVPSPRRRRRATTLLVGAGVAGAVMLSLSMTNTFSAFTAAITNSTNTAASGTVILQETGPGGTPAVCNSTDTPSTISINSFSCSTINKYGGSVTMVPTNAAGTSNLVTTVVTFKNTGTAAAASFTLAPSACTKGLNGTPNGSATDFCSKVNVAISSGGTVVQAKTTLTALATGGAIALPAALIPAPGGAAVPFTFVVSLDTTADNTYQGLSASQPLVWTLSS